MTTDLYNGLVALSIIFLAALVQASLQVATGSLLVLFHSRLTNKSKKNSSRLTISERTRCLASNFSCGAFSFTALLVAAFSFTISSLTSGGFSKTILLIIAAFLFALSVITWLFYYKTGRTTELWLPRKFARFVSLRTKTLNSGVEAFSLGMLSVLAEMPFAVLLVIIAADSVLELPFYAQPATVLLYALVAVLPLIIMRFAIRNGKTILDIQKWRLKNKKFLCIITGILFMTLSVFVLIWKVI